MEHQLSTSTVSRHVCQIAERLEAGLGEEQPSFIFAAQLWGSVLQRRSHLLSRRGILGQPDCKQAICEEAADALDQAWCSFAVADTNAGARWGPHHDIPEMVSRHENGRVTTRT